MRGRGYLENILKAIFDNILRYIREIGDKDVEEELYLTLIGLLLAAAATLRFRAISLVKDVLLRDRLIDDVARLGEELPGGRLRADYGYLVAVPLLIGIELKRGGEIVRLPFPQLLNYIRKFDLNYYVLVAGREDTPEYLEEGLSRLGVGVVRLNLSREGRYGIFRRLLREVEGVPDWSPPLAHNGVVDADKELVRHALVRIHNVLLNLQLERSLVDKVALSLLRTRRLGVFYWQSPLWRE